MELHKIQREILKELSFANKMSFGEFKVKDTIEQDLYNYHLQTLVKSGHLKKDADKKYYLSEKGKTVIQFMDVTNDMTDVKMPKVTVLIFLIKEDKVLLSQRMRHPYRDNLGFASSKIEWGESTEDALKLACRSEIGIEPTKYNLYAIRRCMDLSKEDKVVIHDAVYFIYKITEFKGEIVNTSFSRNMWYKFSDVKNKEVLPVSQSIIEEYMGADVSNVFYKSMETNNLEL